MHKKLSFFMKVLAGMLFILACQKEKSLIPNENLVLTGPQDSLPADTIPEPPQPIPQDTIKGLVITPQIGEDDSTIILNMASRNTFPDEDPRLWNHVITGDSSIIIYVLGVYTDHPSPAAGNTAKAVVQYKPAINGDHPFSIHLTGYPPLVGSISVTNTHYTFNWNHDSLVYISPKILSR